ncbi:MAG: [Fe-Fe] hydrogenase large subunit C-terminal domain-containing protein [Herbinix sp.]|nr:[Fe-Fe] hydrogenase large subunit C-terminal domain-containing protein [Herbinix sp.]
MIEDNIMSVLQFEKVNCKNCYKCVRNCPVKAIEVKNQYAQIRESECILCGKCTIVCPQKTKGSISEIEQVKEAIQKGKQVIASVAPSFFAYFTLSFPAMQRTLNQLHFTDSFETAEGAYHVKTEYERLTSKYPERVLLSSCCSSVNELICKYYPELMNYLAPVLTPMQVHAKGLKEQFPEAVIVFISPCISKKAERYDRNSMVDYVITYEELSDWFEEAGVELVKDVNVAEKQYLSRKFPISGGILECMKKVEQCNYISISGFDACVQALLDIKRGELSNCFIEMSLCEGGCIGGPSFQEREHSLLRAMLKMKQYISVTEYEKDYNLTCKVSIERDFQKGDKAFLAMPSENQITAVMRKMGKRNKADELNCSMCGYASCRDKAVAVILGKAEINMCLPFMKERAESFSNQIIGITPNAILAVDMDLKVQQINQAACDIFKVSQEDIINQPVSRILDEFDFVHVLTSNDEKYEKYEKNAYLAEYNAYLNQIFLYDKASSMVVCIMKNITADRQKKNLLLKKKIQAAAMADDIADRQLRIVHEIASILGETAAETKIAIHDLKETILMDDEE